MTLKYYYWTFNIISQSQGRYLWQSVVTEPRLQRSVLEILSMK